MNTEATHFESLYPDSTREHEISKILSFIKEGSSCQIIGLPGGGRSNLLGLLSYNRNVRIKHLGENQKWFHFVLCNSAEVRKRPLSDVTKFLFLSLIDSLRNRYENVIPSPSATLRTGSAEKSPTAQRLLNEIPPLVRQKTDSVGMTGEKEIKKLIEIFKESVVGNDELVLFQGLKRAIDFLAIEKELTVVFLFDKFEDYIPTVTPEFFTNLRVLRDRAKYRFAVVFSLHKPLEDLIGQDLLLDFYQFVAGHTIYLPLFDKPGLDFRISYMEKASGKILGKEIIDAIINLTFGHPNLTRLSVEALLASSNQRLASSLDFQKFLLEQKPIKAALFDIWKSLTPSEQNILASSSLASSVQLKNKSTSYFENVGLVKNNKITIPLFSQFVKQFTKASSHTAFDPNTLSDSLTSSEFKLLMFLFQNNGRLVEREEVINAVWADNKSSSGVTDQALDQLIFRLRKKIEDDPNKPAHLQTVKGRGFKFKA